jgi:hypothetical protein
MSEKKKARCKRVCIADSICTKFKKRQNWCMMSKQWSSRKVKREIMGQSKKELSSMVEM